MSGAKREPLGLDRPAPGRRRPEPDPITDPTTSSAPSKSATKVTARAVASGPRTTTDGTGAARTVGSWGVRTDLLDRMRAAAVYLGSYEPNAGIRSMSDILDAGLEKVLPELERKYHGGKPFPEVAKGRPGRRHQQ